MQKVAVIGAGNAGGQIANLAKSLYGIEGIAINTSEEDTQTIRNITSILIGDKRGAGKDRVIARNFLRNNIESVLDSTDFKELIDNHELFFIPSSTGGGSGSAIAPVLVRILSGYYPDKKFITQGVINDLKESVAAQQNTLDYLKELRKVEGLTYMLYDNGRANNKNRREMLMSVNERIVRDIATLRGDHQLVTPYTSIDKRDSTKIYSTEGRLVIAYAEGFREKDLSDMSIDERLIQDLRTSAQAELDIDQIVKRFGIITNLSDKIHTTFDPGVARFKELVGEPIEEFEHIYVNSNADDVNRVITIMSGLSMPDDRIEKIIQRIKEVEMQLSRVKGDSILDDANTEFVNELRQGGGQAKRLDKGAVKDLFDDY